jgi:predicted nucleotidyltransferase
MKLISWKEKYPERSKDADDLLLIMHEYEHAGNFDRLYASELDLLTEEGFDNQTASIRLLGRDMAMIIDKDTAKIVISILEDETHDSQKLIIDIMRERKMFDEKFATIKLHLEKLKQGLIETLEKG